MSDRECIAIVTPSFDSYSETFIRNHIKYLPGDKIVIYAFGHDAHYEDGATLLRMNTFSRLLRFIDRKLRGVSLVDQESAVLIRSFKKKRVAAVLAEYGITGTKLLKACQASNIPLVVHFHGYDASRYDILQEYRSAYQQMFLAAKAMIAVSTDMKKKLIDLGAKEEKVKYIPYGIDVTKFSPRTDHSHPPVFLAVGRFVEKKAAYLTLLAFAKVVSRLPQATLVMAGDGPLLSVCKQLSKSLQIWDKVAFRGAVTNEEVVSLMQQASCFVQHSITAESGDAEGTPLAVLEASATGLPVVSTRHAGIKDAVRHGETGFLVEEGDVNGMAEHMIMVGENPELARTMGLAGRKWIEQNYNLTSRIAELWTVLKQPEQKSQ